jgi:hypothetical protein
MLQIDFLVYCLRKNYTHVYHLVNSLQRHVYRLQRLLILDTNSTNKAIDTLRMLIANINIEYNSMLVMHHNNRSSKLIDKKFKTFSTKESLYNFFQSHNSNLKLIHPYSTNDLYPLLVIVRNMINNNFMFKYGISNLKYLQIIHGSFTNCLSIENKDPHILNNFIIYKMSAVKEFTIPKQTIENDDIQVGFKHVSMDNVRIKLIRSLQYVYTSTICIQFKLDDDIYSCDGFFANDFLHLDTKAMCQCLFPKLYKKKEILFNLTKQDSYTEDCVKMCDKAILLALSNDEIIKDIGIQKQKYHNLTNYTYEELIIQYNRIKNNDILFFKIIKTLLIGSNDSVFKATRLFAYIRKDNCCIAKQIYFYLPYPLQLAICQHMDQVECKLIDPAIRSIKIDEKFKIINNIGSINTICIHGLTHNVIGTILNIQICPNYEIDSKFKFVFTGCPDDIMKQSIRCSYSCAIEYIKKNKDINIIELLRTKFPSGFHIHLGDFDSIKSGNSACCAITIAFISLIFEIKIKNDILVTGTVDIAGNILPVGDILTKLHSIEKHKINKVLIPVENYNLLTNAETENNDYECISVSNISQVVNLML